MLLGRQECRMGGNTVGDTWAAAGGENLIGPGGYDVKKHGKWRSKVLLDWYTRGMKNVWGFFFTCRHGNRKSATFWRILRQKNVVQGFSVFVTKSCAAVISLQKRSQQEENLISCSAAVHRTHSTKDGPGPMTTQKRKWGPVRRLIGESGRLLAWHLSDWCSEHEYFWSYNGDCIISLSLNLKHSDYFVPWFRG